MNKDNKKFIIETLFLKESLKQDLTLKEFLVLMYFDNNYEAIFDVKAVSKAICLNEKDVLNAFGTLLDKKLITLNSVKNESGKLVDKISLDNLYNGMRNDEQKKEKQAHKDNFYNKFQMKYGRSLSGMDYDTINAWLASDFSEELILGALDEANYNGVSSLRYIDKILFEWKKKNLKTMQEVNDHLKSRENNNSSSNVTSKLMEYNWLDED